MYSICDLIMLLEVFIKFQIIYRSTDIEFQHEFMKKITVNIPAGRKQEGNLMLE